MGSFVRNHENVLATFPIHYGILLNEKNKQNQMHFKRVITTKTNNNRRLRQPPYTNHCNTNSQRSACHRVAQDTDEIRRFPRWKQVALVNVNSKMQTQRGADMQTHVTANTQCHLVSSAASSLHANQTLT